MFVVEFHGNYIPLQGIQYIIRAAHIIQKGGFNDLQFKIIGKGQTYKSVKSLSDKLNLSNVIFIERIPIEKIVKYIKNADICLGIFGDTDKTLRVIPNKVYEAIAMKKPVISADTPAIRELFRGGENILLCQRANPEDLAEKILLLKEDAALRARIAEGGYKLYKEKATPKIIGKELANILKDVCK